MRTGKLENWRKVGEKGKRAVRRVERRRDRERQCGDLTGGSGGEEG